MNAFYKDIMKDDNDLSKYPDLYLGMNVILILTIFVANRDDGSLHQKTQHSFLPSFPPFLPLSLLPSSPFLLFF
jgi:hypothetical protein